MTIGLTIHQRWSRRFVKKVVVTVATVRENRNVTLVVTKYDRHHVESRHVSQTHTVLDCDSVPAVVLLAYDAIDPTVDDPVVKKIVVTF